MKRPAHPVRWVLLGLALCIALALFLLYRPRTAADVLSSHGTGLTYGEVICTSAGPTSKTITCTPRPAGTAGGLVRPQHPALVHPRRRAVPAL